MQTVSGLWRWLGVRWVAGLAVADVSHSVPVSLVADALQIDNERKSAIGGHREMVSMWQKYRVVNNSGGR